jgi:hypothetical protein
LLNLVGVIDFNKSLYMLANEWHIKILNSNLIIIVKAIKESFLLKLLKELSLLLYLASSKKILLSFNPLVCCRCSIDISLIER